MRGEVRQVEREKIRPREKKKLDRRWRGEEVRPLGLNTANLHTSIFDALKKADGDYIFSCCDLLWFPALVSARPHYGEV